MAERVAALLGEVAYSAAKEATRSSIASAIAVVAAGTAARGGTRRERLRTAGALLLLVVAAGLFVWRLSLQLAEDAEQHAHEQPRQRQWWRIPPPPPPPPPPSDALVGLLLLRPARAPAPPPPAPPLVRLARGGRDAAGAVAAYVRDNPYQVAAVAGSLLLADLLNVAITIDRLDPLVTLARFVGRPFVKAGSLVWRLILRQRARAALQAARHNVGRSL